MPHWDTPSLDLFLARVGWLEVHHMGFCRCGWEVPGRAGRQRHRFLRPSCQGRQSRLCERGPPSHSQQIRPCTHHLACPAPTHFFVTTNTQEFCKRGSPAQASRRGKGLGDTEDHPRARLRAKPAHPSHSGPVPGASMASDNGASRFRCAKSIGQPPTCSQLVPCK